MKPDRMARASRLVGRIAALAALAAAALSAAAGQERPAIDASPPVAAGTDDEKAKREADLKALQEALAASAEARRRLDAEIDAIRTDRAKLK
jgi:murein hydrolase activator